MVWASTGLWLVKSDHVTWVLASDWSRVITWPGYWPLIGPPGSPVLIAPWHWRHVIFILTQGAALRGMVSFSVFWSTETGAVLLYNQNLSYFLDPVIFYANRQLAFWLLLINWYWNVVHCPYWPRATDPDFATFIFLHLSFCTSHIFIHANFASHFALYLFLIFQWFLISDNSSVYWLINVKSEKVQRLFKMLNVNSSKSMNLNPELDWV